MQHYQQLKVGFVAAMSSLYGVDVDPTSIQLSPTRKEFDGHYTIVIFPYLQAAKVAPPQLGEAVGNYLAEHVDIVDGHNTIKGFLNLSLSKSFWNDALDEMLSDDSFGRLPQKGQTVMVEFSSPNTNKPLHLGHIRNILLGWSVSQVLRAAGYDVVNTQIINDRGIAICKSMLAWQLYGGGETPETTGEKGDHLVGKYYVRFNQALGEEYANWQTTTTATEVYQQQGKADESDDVFYKRYKNDYFNNYSKLGEQAKQMLLKWEAGDPDTVSLWRKMNGWVYEGFDKTYEALGVSFDKLYYESNTYLLGKESVQKGQDKDIFYSKDDGSVWVDLTDAGMDEKIVLRSDGTAVYMTQDIGTAQQRYSDYKADKMVYVVGNEQDYHFKVLFEIMKRLDEPFAEGLYHLSYGMVDLPSGRMKSREGTVVDADDLIAEVIQVAADSTKDRSAIEALNPEEQASLHRKLGLAALKFFILKVQPQKGMTFDPQASVDMQGQTGPYVQNAYVRVQSLLRKQQSLSLDDDGSYTSPLDQEIDLLRTVAEYEHVLASAADNYDPASIANYCYALAKDYHKYYHDVRILGAESDSAKIWRVNLSQLVAVTLRQGMQLLGITMPDRM